MPGVGRCLLQHSWEGGREGGKKGGQPGGGRRLERGMKRVKQCLGALFSFSSIPKQQISPGLRQAISVPARRCNLMLGFPAALGAARGILRVCPTQVEASLPPFLCWASSGTGRGHCPGLGHSGISSCLSYSWFLAEKRNKF